MIRLHQLITDLVSLLDDSGFCSETQILETSIFSSEQFAFKIRTTIFSSYSLQIRIYFNRGHLDYSYQAFDEGPLCRWDNKEHFRDIKTYPHHFHTITGEVIKSPLPGNPVSDLKLVLKELKTMLEKGNTNEDFSIE